MDIFPAIDLRQDAGGRCRCVRLLQGRADAETVFSDDPTAVARRWSDCGARWLHVVDLDGAFRGQPVNSDTVAAIARTTGALLQVGGGVRDDRSAELLLGEIGVRRIVVGTRALQDMAWFAALCRRYPGRVAGGVDARNGRVAVEGWTRESEVSAIDAARALADCGAAVIIFTDISTDGSLSGPNVEATEELVSRLNVGVIASGGVATLDDVRRLAAFPLEGIIIGRALYTGAIDLRAAIEVALKA